tara:strand:+ start:572 stop:709 length:138 start_codon:yes stop_codon:yes gene_type:complete
LLWKIGAIIQPKKVVSPMSVIVVAIRSLSCGPAGTIPDRVGGGGF